MSIDGFVEAYDTRTGSKLRVPPDFIGDPIVGRFLKKTPSQRALDGELPPLPDQESTVAEIRGFAAEAEIDVTGLKKHDELLDAVLAAAGEEAVLPTEPDPNTPADTPDLDPTPGTSSVTDETPGDGDKEN